MKAVVMAGGKGTRLAQAKGLLNKHVLPVFDRPMIEHVVNALVGGGATEILILLNWRYPEAVMEVLEDGSRLGCEIYYRYVREIDGPGRQLWLAEKWVNGEDFVLMLGDSLYLHPLDFRSITAPHIWTMPLNGIDDPEKYGQVKVDGKRVLELREKPKILFSNLIQTATWFLPPDAFKKAKELEKTTEGEIHIGAIAEEYVREGRMTHTPLPAQSYLDLGTPESLLVAANLLRQRSNT
jgi:glucose-1-phosphate thymidylyltransferase